jgi:hypothetical protein
MLRRKNIRFLKHYPKGTLRLWWDDDDQDVKEYKSKDKEKQNWLCRNLCTRLNIELADENFRLTDDDIDAILCSLAAVSTVNEVWTEDDLKRRLKERTQAM